MRFKSWESLPPGVGMMPRARAELRSFSMVLISPLCPSREKGWARSAVGRVLVEWRVGSRGVADLLSACGARTLEVG